MLFDMKVALLAPCLFAVPVVRLFFKRRLLFPYQELHFHFLRYVLKMMLSATGCVVVVALLLEKPCFQCFIFVLAKGKQDWRKDAFYVHQVGGNEGSEETM